MDFGTLYQSALDYELGGNDSSVLFLTARRKAAINEGLRQFADLTECYLKSSTIPCTNGIGEYNLMSTVNVPGGDYVRLTKEQPEFRLVSTSATAYTSGDEGFVRRSLQWLHTNTPGWRGTTGGSPEAFYLRDDGTAKWFGLTPPPTISTAQTATIYLPYVARPSSMTASTDVPFGSARIDLEPYHQALVHYAASKLEKLRKDRQASADQLQMFLGYVQRYQTQARPKGMQTIRYGRNYFAEARSRRGGDEDAA